MPIPAREIRLNPLQQIAADINAGRVMRERSMRGKLQAASTNALRRAKKLAEAHPRIIIDKDREAYWVTCDGLEGDEDPLEGSHFCVGGQEVLEAVEAYVKHLTA